jgi:uncharacterized protein YidB (DUF937 family)
MGNNQGGANGNAGALVGALGGLLGSDGDHGGLGGLVNKFQQAGLGQIASSWVSQGANQPVTADQVHQALGADTVSKLASQTGIDVKSLLPMLATALPAIVNQLTPNGQVPAQGAGTQNELLSMLTGFLQQHQS